MARMTDEQWQALEEAFSRGIAAYREATRGSRIEALKRAAAESKQREKMRADYLERKQAGLVPSVRSGGS